MKQKVVLLIVSITMAASLLGCGGFLSLLKKKWRLWNQDETMLVLAKLEARQNRADKESIIVHIKNRRDDLIQHYHNKKISAYEFDQEIKVLYAKHLFLVDQTTMKELFADFETTIKTLHENHTEIYFNNSNNKLLKKDT